MIKEAPDRGPAEMEPGGVRLIPGVYPDVSVPSLSGRLRGRNPAVNHCNEMPVVGVTPWKGPRAWSE